MNQSTPSPEEQQRLNAMMAVATLQRRVKSGASNFYWIAGMSVINSLIYIFGAGLTFVIGLGITQLIDGFAHGLAIRLPGNEILLRGFGLLIDILIAGVFVAFGYFAAKGHKVVFIVGMVLYGVDALLMLAFADWVGFLFHLFFLFLLFGGLQALNKLGTLAPQTVPDPAFPKSIGG